MLARDHVDYYYVKWSAYATIDGERIAITGFDMTYALDKIPTVTFYPTIGIEPTSKKEAKAVAVLLDTRPYTPVEIFVEGKTRMDSPKGARTPGFPLNAPVKIFEGFYLGVGYQSGRSPAGGSVKIEGTAAHWLTGLTGTSSKTVRNTVKGPGGFAEVANIGSGPGFFDVKSLISSGPGSASADIWVEFIKEFFYEIIADPDVWGGNENKSALAALDRMDNIKVFSGAADNSLVIPITLAGGIPDEMLVRFYTDCIAEPLFREWRQNNLWSALQMLKRIFSFRIVPLIDTASCAPIFGALGGEPFVTITTDEYFDCYLRADTPALITKLVLTGSVALAASPYSVTAITSAIMGIASSEDAWVGPINTVRGITINEIAPRWLGAEVTIGKLTRFGLGGASGIIPDAVNPDANSIAPDYDYQEQFSIYMMSDMGNRVAQTMLFDRMLADRYGWISGRFRLDICPGSTIRIQVIDDKFSKFNTSPKHLYALVDSVNITMKAGDTGSVGKASTQFGLRYVRSASEHENFDGLITVEKHPVYGVAFKGAKLWSD